MYGTVSVAKLSVPQVRSEAFHRGLADWPTILAAPPNQARQAQAHHRGLWLGDVKIKCPLGSSGLPSMRGALVGLGNTLPAAREQTHGLRERGTPSDGPWKWRAGVGHVEPKDGQYTRALASGCEVSTLLFETLGGFSPDVTELLKQLAEVRENRLTKAEYDETTWSARTWQSFATQQISVALQLAATLEIAHALGIATA